MTENEKQDFIDEFIEGAKKAAKGAKKKAAKVIATTAVVGSIMMGAPTTDDISKLMETPTAEAATSGAIGRPSQPTAGSGASYTSSGTIGRPNQPTINTGTGSGYQRPNPGYQRPPNPGYQKPSKPTIQVPLYPSNNRYPHWGGGGSGTTLAQRQAMAHARANNFTGPGYMYGGRQVGWSGGHSRHDNIGDYFARAGIGVLAHAGYRAVDSFFDGIEGNRALTPREQALLNQYYATQQSWVTDFRNGVFETPVQAQAVALERLQPIIQQDPELQKRVNAVSGSVSRLTKNFDQFMCQAKEHFKSEAEWRVKEEQMLTAFQQDLWQAMDIQQETLETVKRVETKVDKIETTVNTHTTILTQTAAAVATIGRNQEKMNTTLGEIEKDVGVIKGLGYAGGGAAVLGLLGILGYALTNRGRKTEEILLTHILNERGNSGSGNTRN